MIIRTVERALRRHPKKERQGVAGLDSDSNASMFSFHSRSSLSSSSLASGYNPLGEKMSIPAPTIRAKRFRPVARRFSRDSSVTRVSHKRPLRWGNEAAKSAYDRRIRRIGLGQEASQGRADLSAVGVEFYPSPLPTG